MEEYYDGVITKPELSGEYLEHFGILGMRWGVKNGPPYPLGSDVSTGKRLKSGAAGKITKKKTKPSSSNIYVKDPKTGKSGDGNTEAPKDKKQKENKPRSVWSIAMLEKDLKTGRRELTDDEYRRLTKAKIDTADMLNPGFYEWYDNRDPNYANFNPLKTKEYIEEFKKQAHNDEIKRRFEEDQDTRAKINQSTDAIKDWFKEVYLDDDYDGYVDPRDPESTRSEVIDRSMISQAREALKRKYPDLKQDISDADIKAALNSQYSEKYHGDRDYHLLSKEEQNKIDRSDKGIARKLEFAKQTGAVDDKFSKIIGVEYLENDNQLKEYEKYLKDPDGYVNKVDTQKQAQEKKAAINRRLQNAKTLDQWDINFLEAVQNKPFTEQHITGDMSDSSYKNKMLQEYKKYLEDPEKYWKER